MEFDIVRAWKDEVYYRSLSDEERAVLQENPVGAIELTEDDLEFVQGGHMLTCHFNCLCISMPIPCTVPAP